MATLYFDGNALSLHDDGGPELLTDSPSVQSIDYNRASDDGMPEPWAPCDFSGLPVGYD